MESARQGRRATRRASQQPLGAPEGRLERAQTLAQQLIVAINSYDIDDLGDEVLNSLEDLVSKITQDTLAEDQEAFRLDNECLYKPSDDEPGTKQPTESSSSHVPRLEHHINLRAGRSTVHKTREKYFPPVAEADPEEQNERSQRTSEANLRKATGKARDLALAEDCGLWVTLTEDELHQGELTPEAVSKFLNKAARTYKRSIGKHLHYVGVIGTHGHGPHVHALFSRDLDPEILRDAWPFGAEAKIIEIPEEEIETKVRYMAKNIRDHRLSHSRFFRSRGAKAEKIVLPVASVEEARAQLEDLIGPDRPRLMSAQPFGENPRYAFRFKPVRGEGHG